MSKNTGMNEALFVLTPKATIQNVNPAACTLLGYAADELIDQPIRMVFAEESPFKDAGIEVIIREGTFSGVELTLRTKDSRIIPVLFSSLVMRDEKGEIQSIVCVAQDITGQKQMEEELRKYREHLDELVEERTAVLARSRDYIENILASMTDALIVVGPGAIIQSVNKATCDLLGYNKDELIGMPIGNIFAEEEEEEEEEEFLFTEKILSMVGCKLQGIYEKDKEKFLALLETAPLGVVMVNSTGKIVMVNTRMESLFGYKKKELLGHSIDILLPEEYRQAHAEHRRVFISNPVSRPIGKGRILKAQRKDGSVFEAEIGLFVIWVKGKIRVISIIGDASLDKHWQLIKLTPFGQLFAEEEEEEEEVFRVMDKKLVTKSGNKIPVLMSGSVMRDKGSAIQGAVLVAKDITERKRMETELKARASQQLAVASLGQRALAGTDLSTLMDEAVSFVAQTLEVEYCKILELLPDGNALLLRAGVGWKEGYVGHATVGVGTDSQAGYTLLCNEPVIVEDLRTETRFSGPPLLHDHGVVSGISAVIYGKDQPFGVLGAHTTQRRTFTQDDVHFIQAIANVLAEAIERKQTEEELRILNTIMEAVHNSSDLKEIFNIAIDKVMELTDIDIVGIYLVDGNRNEAVLEAHRGYPDKYIERAGRIPYPKGVTWKVINSGETYIVQDVATDPYVGSAGKESGFQSFMSVPIKVEDRAIGAIHFHSYKKNKFGKREVGLFSSIGTQIAIAVAKAKQRKDLQLVNEDLSVLNTIATSVHKSLSLKEVYNIVLNAVVEITAFDIIMIYLVDEDTNEAVLQVHRGLTEDYIKRAGRIPYPKGVTWKAINSGELTFIDDLQKDPDLGPAGRALGHRTMLAVPIKQEEKTIGLVGFASRRVLELTSRDINLLNAIGSQIGTAIVQAYLYEKSQKQAKELQALYEDLTKRNKDLEILNTITQAVNQSLDLEETYKIALDMITTMENVDMAMIYLVDETRKEAVLQASRNVPEDYISRAGRIPYPKGITWKVISTGEIMNVEDVQKDSNIGPAGRDLGHHSVLGIPITLQGEVIGVIWFLSYKERQFDKQEIDLLFSIGTQIAIAIAKAKLYRELSKKNRYEVIISAVTRSVHQSVDLQEVMENAVVAMSKNIDGADNVSIYLVEGEDAVLKAHSGYPVWFIERVKRIPYPKGLTWKTIIEAKLRYCADVDQDTVIGPAGREMGTKSYVSMPIRFEDKVVGCININSLQKNAFEEEEIKLLEVVTRQIEIAISNAKQVEALRKSEEQQALILRSVPMALYSAQPTCDFSAKWVSENIKNISGFPPDQFINDTHFWASRLHPDDRERVLREFEAILTKDSIATEYRWRIADGSYHWFLDQAVLVRDEEGKPKEIIGTWLDITDRRQAEEEVRKLNLELEQRVTERTAQLKKANQQLRRAKEEAEQANRAKSEFLSRVSHELRTPMNSILGFSQLLEMDSSLTLKQKEGVKHILKAGRHLLDLINDVLDIARIESDHLRLSLEPINVHEIMRGALELVKPIAMQRKIGLQLNLAGDKKWYILADKQRIKQVILNLLSNAVKYNHEGGILTFSCEEVEGKRLRIKIRDTGPGIPPEKMNRLFTPFDRLGAEQVGVEGTGLGLALSKRLVKAMGGEIGVESTVGQGSTFWVELSLVEGLEENLRSMDEAVLSRDNVEATGGTHTVLYIEDNLSNLSLIEGVLIHRPGVNLLTATQGSLGLDLAREHQPDLILLDLNLPDISGEEVLRRLKEDAGTCKIPVVIISADAIPARVQKLLASGTQAYLTKPIDLKKFLNMLDEILIGEVALCEKKH